MAQGGAVGLVGSPEGGGGMGLGANAAGVVGEGGGQGEADDSRQQGGQGGQGEDPAPHQRPRVGVRSVSFSAAAVTDSGGGGQERQGEVEAGSEVEAGAAVRDGEGEGAGEGAQLQLACQAKAPVADPVADPSATVPVLLVVAANHETLPTASRDASSSTSIESSSSSSRTSASINISDRLDAEASRKPGQTSSLPTITLHSVSSERGERGERGESNGRVDAGASPVFSPCEAAERGFKERQLAAQQLLVSKNPAAFLEAVAAKEEAEHRLLLEKAAARWHKAEAKAAQPQLVLQFRSSVRELQALRPYFICPQQRIRVHTLPALTGRVKDSRPPGPLGSALSPSFFLQRKADSDGQDLYDTSRVRAQQFHMDWGRISAKAGWRSALHSCLAAHPGRGAAQGGAPEALVALQQECCRWSSKLRAVFTYYSCQGPGAGPQSVQSLTRSQWRAFFTDTQLLVLDVESEPTPAPAASEVALPPPTTPTPPPSTHPGKHGEGHGHQPQGSGVGSGHGLGGDSDKHLTLVDPQQASVTTGGSDPSSSKGLGPRGSSDSKPWGVTLGTRSTLAAYGGREEPGREQVLAACRCSDEELEVGGGDQDQPAQALFMQATEDDGEVHRASSVRLNRDCMLRQDGQASDGMFEFVSALLRCVVSKLVGAHVCFRASDALHLFMTQVLLPPLSASALQEPDVFRESRLYRADVQATIQHHWPLLQVGVGAVEAKLVFCWSQLQVPDEVRQRQRALTLGLWDFIEAVCRLADLLSPPSPEELDQALVMDLGCAPDSLPAPEAKLAHYYQLSKGTRRSLRSQPSTSQGVSSRPLSVKLHALAAVFCTYCMATWGGADEAECGARMSHMAAIIAA
ncbi:hypothetical protein QJQ45_027816 [Haematococcus lacustris]|nr:hypothetical protein QJQ45_027816 [Haematococcus lacustris]